MEWQVFGVADPVFVGSIDENARLFRWADDESRGGSLSGAWVCRGRALEVSVGVLVAVVVGVVVVGERRFLLLATIDDGSALRIDGALLFICLPKSRRLPSALPDPTAPLEKGRGLSILLGVNVALAMPVVVLKKGLLEEVVGGERKPGLRSVDEVGMAKTLRDLPL
jgi:hypothetical protein